ncbi:MAG: protein translocase subunit SecDF [Bacteroidetes bacterium]|nr:protein translocase subunit SecDF [Bacteroidota bacterium]
MKQKNLVLWLLIVFAAISAWNIFYTYERLGMDAEMAALPDSSRATYLEQNYEAYQAAVNRSLGLGLDLQGGMYVTMEIGVDELILAMAGRNADTTFVAALNATRKLQAKEKGDFVDIFVKELRARKPGVKLAAYFGGEGMSYNTTDEEVVAKIKSESDTAIENAFTVIRKRVDQFGVASANIQKVTGTNRIMVELPGVKDVERVRKLLKNTARLEFWPTYTLEEAYPYLIQINNSLKGEQKLAAGDSTRKDSTATTAAADSNLTQEQQAEKFRKENPLLGLLAQPQSPGKNSPLMGYAKEADTSKVNAMLRSDVAKGILPEGQIRFAWTAKMRSETQMYELVALKVNPENEAPITGDAINDTRSGQDENNQYMVTMNMNSDGTKKWRQMTTEYLNKSIAVVLDGLVYTYPVVQSVIANGSSQITGNFTPEEATDLANILKAGKLPAPARIVGEEVVGPSLGKETVNRGLISFLLGFAVVLLFMWAYYRKAGMIANIALLVNLFFLIGVCAALNVVLTLPGIAGIVLTMAMAVDSNVLIYERVREELAAGRSSKASLTAGFKGALSAIVDGNITTLLIGVILFVFGTGPIQGFAVTLIIGIGTTLISALLVTRLLLDYVTNRPNAKPMSFGSLYMTNFFQKTKLSVIPNRKKAYLVTGALAAASLVAVLVLGFKFGVDFRGGRQYTVEFSKPVSSEMVDQLREDMGKAYSNEMPQIKAISGKNQVMIATAYLIDEDADDKVLAATQAGLANFKDANPVIIQSSKVGPTVVKDIKDAAQLSVILSLVVMFLYIFLRFQRWQYGMGAVVSLAFNVIVVLGVFALLGQVENLPFNAEVDLTFVGAILTVIGYTINDTVIVFDRIRERVREDKTKVPMPVLFNEAVNETFSRTIVTSCTTILSALILFFFAGEVLQAFMLSMILGIIIGTFSSIIVATPVSLDFILATEKREAQRKKEKAPVAAAR